MTDLKRLNTCIWLIGFGKSFAANEVLRSYVVILCFPVCALVLLLSLMFYFFCKIVVPEFASIN